MAKLSKAKSIGAVCKLHPNSFDNLRISIPLMCRHVRPWFRRGKQGGLGMSATLGTRYNNAQNINHGVFEMEASMAAGGILSQSYEPHSEFSKNSQESFK